MTLQAMLELWAQLEPDVCQQVGDDFYLYPPVKTSVGRVLWDVTFDRDRWLARAKILYTLSRVIDERGWSYRLERRSPPDNVHVQYAHSHLWYEDSKGMWNQTPHYTRHYEEYSLLYTYLWALRDHLGLQQEDVA